MTRSTPWWLTHGHEDHIGGVPLPARCVRHPLIGSKLTLAFVDAEVQGTPPEPHQG